MSVTFTDQECSPMKLIWVNDLLRLFEPEKA